ncbi:unnamed protein product [Rotaria sp. Silwood2]|nr:unnamed protein product [Rotaria sp. Silwood2]
MELCCCLPGRHPHLLRLNKGTQETRGRSTMDSSESSLQSLKHCCTQMATKESANDTNNELISELLEEDETNDLEDSQNNNSDE